MDRCEHCFKPAGHTHPRCGHCHGTGRCPVPFCVKCAGPRFDDLPFPCGTCLWCAGDGIDRRVRDGGAPGRTDRHPERRTGR